MAAAAERSVVVSASGPGGGWGGPIQDPRQNVLRKEGRLAARSQPAGPGDAELTGGVRAGDPAAMAQLYDRYSSLVYAVALRVLADAAAAEDVLQDVFMQLWRSPGLFDASRGSLGAWLAVIARHRAIDQLRKRRPETDVEEVVLSVEAGLDDAAERSRFLEKVRRVLAALPAEQRSALEMAFFEGLTHSEISQQTGQPLGTIKTRIRSALLALRKALAP